MEIGEIVHRDWGWYEVLAAGEKWRLKRLVVKPRSKSSVQRHFKRYELWFYPHDNTFQIVWQETWHQLVNDTDKPMEIIELWMGNSSEEDIERSDVENVKDIYFKEDGL